MIGVFAGSIRVASAGAAAGSAAGLARLRRRDSGRIGRGDLRQDCAGREHERGAERREAAW